MKNNNITLYVGLFLVVVLIIGIMFYIINVHSIRSSESFTDYMAQLNGYSMGAYDNLIINETTPEYPFYKPMDAYKTYQGTPGPLKDAHINTLDGSESFPPVDGKPSSPRDMFMFAYNRCSPECCPSSISCDHGCVCVSPQQTLYMSYRGNNSTYCNTPFVPEMNQPVGYPVGSYGMVEEY